MKILYISKVDISKTDGPGVNERGFISILYNLISKDAYFIIPEPEGKTPEDIPLDSVTFFESSQGRKPLPWVKQQFSLLKTVKNILKDREFDMMIIRTEIFPLAEYLITKKYNIPFALRSASDGKYEVLQKKNRLYRSLSGFNLKMYKEILKKAFLIDTVSPEKKSTLNKLISKNNKVVWIDNGVETNRFRPFPKKKLREEFNLEKYDPIIGYAGNLPWERGAMQILKALPKLKKIYPNIGGISLGSGKEMKKLYDKARELGIEDRMVFTGQVPYEDVPKYINCMDIGVSQLFKKSQNASEQKVRQYLACGKPIIVSPGSVNQFVEENKLGFIVDPNNEEEFYKTVVHLLKMKPKEFDLLSKNARNYAVQNMSYKSKVEQRLSLYKEKLKL